MIKFFEVLCSNFNQCYSNFNQWWPLPCSKYRLNNIPLTSIIQIPLMCFRTRLLWQRSFLSRSMINLCVVNGHASTRKIIGCPVKHYNPTQQKLCFGNCKNTALCKANLLLCTCIGYKLQTCRNTLQIPCTLCLLLFESSTMVHTS